MLMGLANLVPGISGGTMLLASGIYPRFIAAIAEMTTLRFRVGSLVVLGTVVVAAAVGILLLAGVVKDLVVERRWIMYSLFIGLTLGGLPVVWRMARPATGAVWRGAAAGFVAMAALALAQQSGAGDAGAAPSNFALLFLAGLAGAGAMILPGVSGGYLLLVLGQYVPILSGIEAFKDALGLRDLAAAMDPAMGVLLPVGLGVVAGVVGVSNLLKWLLARYAKATLGVLLGLLVGAVVGLWGSSRRPAVRSAACWRWCWRGSR
jgi:putative membrane protein